jgi:hypothetical protein
VALWLYGKFIRVHVAWFDLERYCKSGFTGGKFCAENEKGRVVGLEPFPPFLTPLLSIHFKSLEHTFDIQCGSQCGGFELNSKSTNEVSAIENRPMRAS